MRQRAHILVGIAFWLLFAALWAELIVQHKATAAALRGTALSLGAVIGAVLAITTWWVRHNVRIYRRKGPRQGRPSEPPRTDEDRLERPIRWGVPGGVSRAASHRHLIVELDGDVKIYRAEC